MTREVRNMEVKTNTVMQVAWRVEMRLVILWRIRRMCHLTM